MSRLWRKMRSVWVVMREATRARCKKGPVACNYGQSSWLTLVAIKEPGHKTCHLTVRYGTFYGQGILTCCVFIEHQKLVLTTYNSREN